MKSTVEIQSIVSNEILNKMHDQGAADSLREILFSDNTIDWQKAYQSIIKNMPEIKNL